MGHFDLGYRMSVTSCLNSGSAVRIVLQFCTMKGAKKDMEIILMDWKKS